MIFLPYSRSKLLLDQLALFAWEKSAEQKNATFDAGKPESEPFACAGHGEPRGAFLFERFGAFSSPVPVGISFYHRHHLGLAARQIIAQQSVVVRQGGERNLSPRGMVV